MTTFITIDILKKISPRANLQIITDLAHFLDIYFQKYEINTYLRVCHFLAQAALESDGFKTLQEYASGREYEGRKDLGNVNPGDGVKYKGRGAFQITGRANYTAMSKILNVDLVNHPELAATGEISIQTAMEYWKSHNLNTYADNDDIMTITHKINGGYNGLDGRKAYLAIAKNNIPKNLSYSSVSGTQTSANNQISVSSNNITVATSAVPTPPHINIVMAKIGDNSDYVKSLQDMLNKKGANLVSDGAFGSHTKQAVLDFQTKNNITPTGSIDTDTLNILMI